MYKKNLQKYFGDFVWWMGVVEDRNDPLFLGRCRVRILGYHNEYTESKEIKTNHLPWATPMQPITSAAMNGIGTTPTGPVEGTWVIGFFRDGLSAQQPVMMGTVGGIPEEATWEGLEKHTTGQGYHDPRTNDKVVNGQKVPAQAEDGNDDNKGTQTLKTAPVRVTTYKNTSMSGKVKGPHYNAKEEDDYIKEEENATNFPKRFKDTKGVIATATTTTDGEAKENEADTNRLARNENKTIADIKKKNVQKANQTAYSDHESQTDIAGSGSVTKRDKVEGKGRDLTCESESEPSNRCEKTKNEDARKDEDLTIITETKLQEPNKGGGGVFPHSSGSLSSSAIESKSGYDWDEPNTPYNAVYPYNHVYESESGHIVEYDDTKGSERIHQYHRSGTFEEIHPDGTVVRKIVGTNYTIYCEDNNIRIAGDTHITVDRGMKLLVNNAQYERSKLGDDILENDLDIEIAQGSNININVNRGNINCKINEGDINTYLEKGNVYTTLDLGHISNTILEGDSHTQVKKGNVNLRVDEGHIETVLKKGDVKFHQGTGNSKIEIDSGNIALQLTSGDMSSTINGNYYMDCTGDIGMNAGGKINLKSTNKTYIEGTANVEITGAFIHLNTPGANAGLDAGEVPAHTIMKTSTKFNNGSTNAATTLGGIS